MAEDVKIRKGSVTFCWNSGGEVQYYGLSDKALDRIQKIAEKEHTISLTKCPVENVFPDCDRASYNIETCQAEGISCPFNRTTSHNNRAMNADAPSAGARHDAATKREGHT